MSHDTTDNPTLTLSFPRSYLLMLRASVKTYESDKRRALRASIRKKFDHDRIEKNQNSLDRATALLDMIDSQLGDDVAISREIVEKNRRDSREKGNEE